MAKFYCESGLFKTIVDAPNGDIAAQKAIRRLLQEEIPHTCFLTLGERGFNYPKGIMYSIIPLLRAEGIPLLPDDELAESICKFLSIPNLSEKDRHWLLYGGASEQ